MLWLDCLSLSLVGLLLSNVLIDMARRRSMALEAVDGCLIATVAPEWEASSNMLSCLPWLIFYVVQFLWIRTGRLSTAGER